MPRGRKRKANDRCGIHSVGGVNTRSLSATNDRIDQDPQQATDLRTSPGTVTNSVPTNCVPVIKFVQETNRNLCLISSVVTQTPEETVTLSVTDGISDKGTSQSSQQTECLPVSETPSSQPSSSFSSLENCPQQSRHDLSNHSDTSRPELFTSHSPATLKESVFLNYGNKETNSGQSEDQLETDARRGPSHDGDNNSGAQEECSICLQPLLYPAVLKCKHVFCFLCLKGVALSKQSCPLCRAPVPRHIVNKPESVLTNSHPSQCPQVQATAPSTSQVPDDEQTSAEEYAWFYQGRHGGWWEFEERMWREIEERRRDSGGETVFDMMICGSLYVIDTMSCIQYPKDRPTRSRRIMRALPSRVHAKGVAGISASTASPTKHSS